MESKKKKNLMAVQPIRHGNTSKEAPAEWCEGIATTFFVSESQSITYPIIRRNHRDRDTY